MWLPACMLINCFDAPVQCGSPSFQIYMDSTYYFRFSWHDIKRKKNSKFFRIKIRGPVFGTADQATVSDFSISHGSATLGSQPLSFWYSFLLMSLGRQKTAQVFGSGTLTGDQDGDPGSGSGLTQPRLLLQSFGEWSSDGRSVFPHSVTPSYKKHQSFK